MFSADQLLAHALGDYVLQSDWMANEKTKRSFAALVHAATYTLAFLLFTQVWWALLIIGGTHFAIDRWRLAKYVCYAKNFLAPPRTIIHERQVTPGGQVIFVPKQTGVWWRPWSECSGTGYAAERPVWLATWLLIITDNLMHVAINGLVLYVVN